MPTKPRNLIVEVLKVEIPQTIHVEDITVSNRIRKDLGDILGLANSIKENGLIEPIVITFDDDNNNGLYHIKLVAGERRLTAMKHLGMTELIHAQHFIYRSELESNDPKKRLLFSAIEMEENVRRKDLSWQEQVVGKQKLLAIMQELHGLPTQGRPSDSQKNSTQPGFGVNKLSEMLGESKAQTSEDLELAALITKIPILAQEPNREAAKRKLELAIKIATGQNTPRVAQILHYKIMIDCDNESQQATLIEQFRSVGLKCQPVVT
jgi:ParB family chromosome partitioning protein